MGRRPRTIRSFPLVVTLASLPWLACTDATDSTVGPAPERRVAAAAHLPQQAQGIEKAIEAQERHGAALMAIPGVVGHGATLDASGTPTVTVFTLTAEVSGVPDRLDDVPTRTVVTGQFVAGATTDRVRPAPSGYSVGHPDITAGTLGAIVQDAGDVCYVLSNNHVLANSNDASLGDSALQPGPYDGGSDPADAIGALADYQVIKFDGSANRMDAAVAEVSTPVTDFVTGSTPASAYGAPGSSVVSPSVGLDVQKFGRTTGLSFGEITEINVSTNVCYQCGDIFCFTCSKLAYYEGQIATTDMSNGGDSGSLTVTDDANANLVGLLFAGSSTRTIHNPIGEVLTRFDATVVSDLGSCSNGGDVSPVTDVAVSSVSAPSSVVEGDVASVDVTVENVGNQDVTSDINVTLNDDTDGVAVGMQTISGGLAAGASTTLTYSWDTSGASEGDHTLTASHDYADDASANDASSTVVTVGSAVTDVAVSSVSAPSSVVEGDVASVDVTVENVGNQDVTSDINVTLNDDTDGVAVGTQTISGGLAAGASTTLTYSWDTSGASEGDHTLTASHDYADDASTNDASSTTVTVDAAADGGATTDMYVWAVDFSQKDYGPGGSFKDLITVVTIQSDSDGSGTAGSSDAPVADASVAMTLTHDTDGDGAFECGAGDDCWNVSNTTDRDGQVKVTLKRALTGDYQMEVTGVAHSSLTWNSSLDADNPDTYLLQ